MSQSSKVVEPGHERRGSTPAPKLTLTCPCCPDGMANTGLEHSLSHPIAWAPFSVPAGLRIAGRRSASTYRSLPGVRMDPDLHHPQAPRAKCWGSHADLPGWAQLDPDYAAPEARFLSLQSPPVGREPFRDQRSPPKGGPPSIAQMLPGAQPRRRQRVTTLSPAKEPARLLFSAQTQ